MSLLVKENMQCSKEQSFKDADSKMFRYFWRRANKYLVINVFALAFVWSISIFTISTLKPLYYEPALKSYVHYPGSTHRERQEGYATTVFGKFGLAGIPDISLIKCPKIVIWGDSQVEALQVYDSDKMAQKFSRIWYEHKSIPLMGVGIGQSFFCAADYYFLIPRYEQVIDDIQHHFILLPSIQDVMPDQENQKRSRFVSSPNLHFITSPEPKINQALINLLYRLRLQMLTRTKSNFMEKTSSIRFTPGPIKSYVKNSIKAEMDPIWLEKAWIFLLKELKSRTKKPITFIYAPTVPYMKNSRIYYTEENSALMKKFAFLCLNEKIGFIDMSPSFIAYYQQTKQFPRGFSNSHPCTGHLNNCGHRLIAEQIMHYMESYINAVHSN